MKKLILKSVLCFMCILSGIQVNAQFVYTGNTSSPTACDGQAYFVDSIANFTSLTWIQSGNTIASDTTYLSGLCVGTYSVNCTGSSTNADTTITFTIAASSPCDNFYVYINPTQGTTPGQCDGSATAQVSGGTAPYTYTWSTGITTQTLTGACSDTMYSVTVVDANGCGMTAWGEVPEDSTVNNPCSGFYATVSVTNISSTVACDGSATATPVGGHAPYAFSWDNAATTATISGLCSGTYTLTVLDSLGCTTTAWANIYADTIGSIDSSLVIYAYPTSVSEDGECDGTLNASAWGGTGVYGYVLSGIGTSPSGYYDSLCQGIYTICAFDSNGDTTCIDVIISNPSNTYNNPTYSDSMYVDSIMGDLQANCQLNYQGIDSVFITGYDIFGDSILVYWNVVTSTGSTTVTQLYYIGGGAGVYSLGLQVYCPGKALGNYFTATDQIYFGGPMGVEEHSLAMVSVYPNPASDVLNIQFREAGDYAIALYDLTGREIMSTQSHDTDHLTVDVSGLAKGQYTLKINGKEGFVSKSILK